MKKRLAGAVAAVALAGGALIAARPTEGCGAKCCMRPAGTIVESCLRRNPNTNVAEDFGGENTMPGTHAVGAGCVPTECVAGQGIEPEDK